MAMKALIVQGGFPGHQPKETADIMAEALRKRGFEVEMSETLDAFKDTQKLAQLDLIVPHWTMGEIDKEQLNGLLRAVEKGVSVAGIHGGMGDAFRKQCQFQLMAGGQFVAHPGGGNVTYAVRMTGEKSPITEGLKDFSTTSEQYYLHVDPGNRVLATTNFGQVVMPVAWTRKHGKGHVYYCSLGHNAAHLAQPEVLELILRGFVWAAQQTAKAKQA